MKPWNLIHECGLFLVLFKSLTGPGHTKFHQKWLWVWYDMRLSKNNYFVGILYLQNGHCLFHVLIFSRGKYISTHFGKNPRICIWVHRYSQAGVPSRTQIGVPAPTGKWGCQNFPRGKYLQHRFKASNSSELWTF